MRRFAVVFLGFGLSAMLATPSHAQSYDLVINGGRVMAIIIALGVHPHRTACAP